MGAKKPYRSCAAKATELLTRQQWQKLSFMLQTSTHPRGPLNWTSAHALAQLGGTLDRLRVASFSNEHVRNKSNIEGRQAASMSVPMASSAVGKSSGHCCFVPAHAAAFA